MQKLKNLDRHIIELLAEIKMIFTAKIQIELDEDAVDKMRGMGIKDVSIIHRICDEIVNKESPVLTELGELEFTDCEIVESKEKETLPF